MILGYRLGFRPKKVPSPLGEGVREGATPE